LEAKLDDPQENDEVEAKIVDASTSPELPPAEDGKPEPVTQSTEEGNNPESAVPVAAARRHSWVYHFFNFLLGKNTRVGRVMRPILRWTAAIFGLFALGLLAGYILLYQPTQAELDAANGRVGQVNASLASAKAQATGLQSSLTAANQAAKKAQEDTTRALARNDLLIVIYDIANARTYLAQKDGAKLMAALDKARADLAVVQPYIQSVKKELADELTSRMETVRTVVVRDSTLAQSDLDNLYTVLLTADEMLFGEKP
jgi:hypothetical protein